MAITIPKDSEIAAEHPLWQLDSKQAEIPRVGSLHPETLLTWTATPAAQLGRGQAASGFQVVTKLRPGLVIAFAEAAITKGATAQAVSALPTQVQVQLAKILQPQ